MTPGLSSAVLPLRGDQHRDPPAKLLGALRHRFLQPVGALHLLQKLARCEYRSRVVLSSWRGPITWGNGDARPKMIPARCSGVAAPRYQLVPSLGATEPSALLCLAGGDGQIAVPIAGVPRAQKSQWVCLTFRGQAEGKAKLGIAELPSRSPAELI